MAIVSRVVQRADRRAALLSRMMGRLGLTIPEAAQLEFGIPMRSACRNCMLCRHAVECEAWLADSHYACVADAPKFCPNATFLRRLVRHAAEGEGSRQLQTVA